MRRILGKKNSFEIQLRGSVADEEFIFHSSQFSDLISLREVFVGRCYDLNLERSPQAVLDLGANAGSATIFFAMKWPNAMVIAVEPDPANLIVLERNCASFSNIRILPVAVANALEVTLFVSDKSSMASSIVRKNSTHRPIVVPGMTLDALISDVKPLKIEMIKFDIEGAEWEAFKESRLSGDVQDLLGEMHADLIPVATEEFLDLFPRHKLVRRAGNPPRELIWLRQRSCAGR